MLDVSVGGHLSSGDTSIEGAIREVNEEVGLEITEDDLKFVTTIKDGGRNDKNFINNQFEDVYFLNKMVKIDDLKYQEEEISEILFVPFDKFKKMILNKDKELIIRDEEFKIMIDYIEKL